MKFKSLLTKTADAIKKHLAQPTMIFTNREAQTVREHIVREDEIARPDLIALEYYGDQSKTDLLLKWNGISDPFSLNPGDVIEIPPSSTGFTKLARPTLAEDNPIKNQFLQDKRLPKKDDRRIEALKKKYNKDVLLPPNVIPVGKKNYKFDKGLVTFGAQAQNAEVNDPVVQQVIDETTAPVTFTPAEPITNVTSGSGSGSGGGTGYTETQLETLLNKGQGGRNRVILAQTGSGKGDGKTATNLGGGKSPSDAPEGTGNANDIANDGAPCN